MSLRKERWWCQKHGAFHETLAWECPACGRTNPFEQDPLVLKFLDVKAGHCWHCGVACPRDPWPPAQSEN